jgi:hypothetical protein
MVKEDVKKTGTSKEEEHSYNLNKQLIDPSGTNSTRSGRSRRKPSSRRSTGCTARSAVIR